MLFEEYNMFKFFSCVIIIINVSCGLSTQTKQSQSTILFGNSDQALSCTLTWDQSWIETQGASLEDMKNIKIEYQKTFELQPNKAFKKLEFTPTTMKSGDLDISYSPNINNFRIQISRIEDLEQYRQLEIDPEKATHFHENDSNKLRWMQQYAFGPIRKETGLAQSGIDDFEEPEVFDTKSPSVQVSLTCKEKK